MKRAIKARGVGDGDDNGASRVHLKKNKKPSLLR